MTLHELWTILSIRAWSIVAFIFGLLWGSFLNVVIYRIPRDMGLSFPASHCPQCSAPVKPYDNIPVLSYLILRGRTRCCKKPLKARYPTVEVLGGVISLMCFVVMVAELDPRTQVLRAFASYIAYFFVCLGLLAAIYIDLDHMYIPDKITYAAIIVGLLTATLRGLTFADAALGGAAGVACLWLPTNALYRALRGRTGLGWGDGKLLVAFGVFATWQAVVMTLFGGAVLSLIFAFALKLQGKELELPEAVRQELEELEKAAKEGDAEAQKLLEEDPLAGDQGLGGFVEPAIFAAVFGAIALYAKGLSSPAVMFVGGGLLLSLAGLAIARLRFGPMYSAPLEDEGSSTSEEANKSEAQDANGDGKAADTSMMQRPMPFGPALILAFYIYIFWAKDRFNLDLGTLLLPPGQT
jgi:leader peptidase (prepilin peptidase) / N-methyltransferase